MSSAPSFDGLEYFLDRSQAGLNFRSLALNGSERDCGFGLGGRGLRRDFAIGVLAQDARARLADRRVIFHPEDEQDCPEHQGYREYIKLLRHAGRLSLV